MSVEKNELNV